MTIGIKRYITLAVGRAVAVLMFATLALTASAAHPELDVVLLGDSNTWIGGDDCSKERGWQKWFIEKFEPGSCRSYARSGATWTNTKNTVPDTKAYSEVLGDNNVIYNQVERLIEAVKSGRQVEPEVIIIGAGANDAWFASKRPYEFHETVAEVFADEKGMIADWQPSKTLTLAGSIRLSCERLMRAFPNAQIVLLTAPQITQCSYEDLRRVNDVITETGHRMSLTVIPLADECGTYNILENTTRRNTADGCHTTADGARRMGRYIASRLESSLLF